MAFQVDSCRGFSGMSDIFRTFPIKTTDKSHIYTNKRPNNRYYISFPCLISLKVRFFSVFTAPGPSLWSHVKMTILTMYYLGSECCCKTYPSQSVSFKRIFNWSADKLNSKSSYSWSKSSSSYQFPF